MANQRSDALAAYQASLRKSRARLDRLLDRRSVLALKRFYDRAQDDLESRLMRMAKGVHKEPLTPLQVQQLLQQVRAAQHVIAIRLHQQFMPISLEAQQEGIEQAEEAITEQHRRAFDLEITLPLGDTAVEQSLIDLRQGQLERLNEKSYRRFEQSVTAAIEGALAVALSLGENPAEAIERIRQTADDNWWQSERIIHTDMAAAFNTASADSITLVGKTLRGLQKRWCELVDDLTGLPLDNRVGRDSIVLHGQVTSQTGFFVMPPDVRVSRSMWNQTYFCSPNRPNDRSVTMPWYPNSGVPGWRWENGQRIDVR